VDPKRSPGVHDQWTQHEINNSLGEEEGWAAESTGGGKMVRGFVLYDKPKRQWACEHKKGHKTKVQREKVW